MILGGINIQPFPACPAEYAPHLKKTCGQKSAIDLGYGYDGVEDAYSERKLVFLVKVRQVEYHFWDEASLHEADDCSECPEAGTVIHQYLQGGQDTPKYNDRRRISERANFFANQTTWQLRC